MKLKPLESAKGDRARHFNNLNLYKVAGVDAAHMRGAFWEVDEALYNEFLNLLPPIYKPGGFAMAEALTGSIRAHFFQCEGGFWCGYAESDADRSEIIAAIRVNAPMEAL